MKKEDKDRNTWLIDEPHRVYTSKKEGGKKKGRKKKKDNNYCTIGKV
jgi:hypothetical protein